MKGDLQYKIKGNKLIIESGLNNKSISFVRKLLKKPMINELVIEEGIEEIGDSYFRHSSNITKVTFPKSLKKIGAMAFANCPSLRNILIPTNLDNDLEIGDSAFHSCLSLRKIIIPNGVSKIHDSAFRCCSFLTDVSLPDNLALLGSGAFADCTWLKTVKFPTYLETIGESAFSNCQSLKNVYLPKNLSVIERLAFLGCKSMTSIKFPNSLTEIGNEAFYNCINLKRVQFNEGLTKIGISAFHDCTSLEDVKLPSSLSSIGERTFAFCSNIKHATIEGTDINIPVGMFLDCKKLKTATLSGSIHAIFNSAFRSCESLEEIILSDSIKTLYHANFMDCYKLKNIKLSNNIKTIPENAFQNTKALETVVIPEGVENIEKNAFYNCSALQEIYLPTTIKNIHKYAFDAPNLKYLYLKSRDGYIQLDMANDNHEFLHNPDGILFLHDHEHDTYGFYINGEYTVFNKQHLLDNPSIVKAIEKNIYTKHMFIRLYYFSKKRFIPSNIIVEHMPLSDIDKFYINKNGQEWGKLIKASKITKEENAISFFKLCYVLGVFSESTNIRDKAIKFINENIINKVKEDYIHSRFDGFDLDNGFNNEYAEFFMKYYHSKNFMMAKGEDEWGEEEDIDLMAASYNNFSKVKKLYPSKTLHTNRTSDLLLPIHVINAIDFIEYDNVEYENEEFALTVGRYGYTQEQFEKLQKWYDKGKNIKKMKLYITPDNKEDGITYSLLSKDNVLNAVLGNITNCCQVLNGLGESCVEYGMIQPNSGFITFNYKGKIIGQAWTWYDEDSKTVCLDNIEIPHRYLEKIHQNKEIQKEFIECLIRIADGFKVEMKNRGFIVDKVTIGEGYNDLKVILNNTFKLTDNTQGLKGYYGYSDATKQYEIRRIEKTYKKN